MATPYINILESGHTVKTSWQRSIGDTVAIPATRPVKYTKVKFALTQQEYNTCLELSKKIVAKYELLKATMIRRSLGWPDKIKQQVIQNIYNEGVGTPLMIESFFLSMHKFS